MKTRTTKMTKKKNAPCHDPNNACTLTTPVQEAASPIVRPADMVAAYRRIEPELATVAVPLRVSVDIPRAVNRVLVSWKALLGMKTQIEALPDFPAGLIDKLPDYALGCLYAHFAALPGTSVDSPAQPLLEEGLPLREKLLTVAEALAATDMLDPAHVAQIRSGTGFVDAAADLMQLAELFTAAWPTLGDRVWITEDEVKRARAIGTQLLYLLNGSASAPAAERRVKSYTLLVDAYEECRRAVGYLRRHEGDAETIAPSLFLRNRSRPSSDPGPDQPEPVLPPPAPNPPVAPPTGDPASAAPGEPPAPAPS